MKNVILLLTIFSVSLSTHAGELKSSFVGSHVTSEKYLKLELNRAQQALGQFLGKNLGCSNIKLCVTGFTKAQSGFFSSTPGKISLSLSATCSKSVSRFRFDLNMAADYEDYSDILVSYVADAREVKADIVSRISGEDMRTSKTILQDNNCDSSPIDHNLPLKIITNPDDMRDFSK